MKTLIALLHKDFVLIQATSFPYGGNFIGKKGIAQFFKRFFDFWESFRSENIAYAEEEKQVFATSMEVGKTKAGKEIRMPMI